MNRTLKIFFAGLIFCVSSVFNISYSQLSGTYTIGSGGNYPTMNAAVTALNSQGVNAPVTFSILNGTYNEYFTINEFPGSSAVNTVTFKSQSGNAADVILTSSAFISYLIYVNGADNLIFSNLTLTDPYFFSGTRVRLQFSLNCANIKILNNRITGGQRDIGLRSATAVMSDLEVSGNTFDIYRGVYMFEPVLPSSNTKILNNSFQSSQAVTLSGHSSVTIEGNFVSAEIPDSTSKYGIYLKNCGGTLKILRNQIRGGLFENITGISVEQFSGASALLANNMVTVYRGNQMKLLNCANIKVYNNTVFADASGSTGFQIINSTGIDLRNNIIFEFTIGLNTSYCYDIQSSSITSNRNVFYNFASVYFAKVTPYGSIVTFDQYKTLTGQDFGSIFKEVDFVSQYDAHLAGSSIGDEALIGEPLPEITHDIDGDPRNPLYPYVGADEAAVTLPVELSSFTASVQNRNVTLHWTTSMEENNSGFEIERKDQSNVWDKVGSVTGMGNSNAPRDYNFTDNNLNSGKYSFRLKQIDFNGSFEYHNLNNEVEIGLPQKYSLSQNYPNPFNPETKINFEIPLSSNVSIKVFDISGKEIATILNEKKEAGYYSIEFNASNISSGVYFYTLQSGNFISTKRMIVVK